MNILLSKTHTSQQPPVRRCACGNVVGPDGECSACRAKRLSGQMPSSGRPLDQPIRSDMERRFGRDFSNIRIHADSEAARSADSVNAAAFAIGQNIVFGGGRYAPFTSVGTKLIAHELAHTVQQRNATAGPSIGPSSLHSETEARSAAASVSSGGPATSLTPVPSLALAKDPPPPPTSTSTSTSTTTATPPSPFPPDEPYDVPEQRQFACLIDRKNCENVLKGSFPDRSTVTAENAACKTQTSYTGPDVWPSITQCNSPQLFKFDAIALARSLATKYPGWLNKLPNCPCTDAAAKAAPSDWAGPNACKPPYHIDAVTGYRSVKGYASVAGTNHGQQCCYDKNGNLITDGAGAGTPDVEQAPAGFTETVGGIFGSGPGPISVMKHVQNDVTPFEELGWEIYNRYWVPNKGVGCQPNKVP